MMPAKLLRAVATRLPTAVRSMASVAVQHPASSTASAWLSDKPPTPAAEIKMEQAALVARVGATLTKPELVSQALTHRSQDPRLNQDRLAPLGRSLILQTLTEYLYVYMPNAPGATVRFLAEHFVSVESLKQRALSLGIDKAVSSKLKFDSKPAPSDDALAASFCAFIAALHLQGKSARPLVRDLFVPLIKTTDVSAFMKLANPKQTLRRLLLQDKKPAPVCKILNESGRQTHLPVFLVGVFSGEQKLAEAASWSIKRAENEAVLAALNTHFGKQLTAQPLPSDEDFFVSDDQISFMERKEATQAAAAEDSKQ
eukprot:m.83327 g.83327  ORF g.83327 m.83327 type:complete len:313 (+) comp14968_c0_seq1:95-1033(+)